jgi:hypothetical protein
MTNIIYNYPKSSCECSDYKSECSIQEKGYPTNLSILNCEIPSCFNFTNEIVFKNKMEPTVESGYVVLNPSVETSNLSKNFYQVQCSPDSYCNNGWTSSDSRLKSVARSGSMTLLDRPPITSEVNIDTIYSDKELENYGKKYKSYADIKAGQITYYIDKSKQDAFYYPDFTTSANTVGILYRDPMGGIRPCYERQPLSCDNPLETKRDREELSWIRDTEAHRQDLLSKQMWKINSQRWEPRWT